MVSTNTPPINTISYAESLDNSDNLSGFRERFYLPLHNGEPCVYFCGNSLGLQPKSLSTYVDKDLNQWKDLGVEGHFKSETPWLTAHKPLAPSIAKIVGALESEVVAMNTLTVNLHLMMVSFYRPKGKRFKILMEPGAFPSDQYAVESQVKFHGLDPKEAIITFEPKEGEEILDLEEMINTIQQHKDELALILMGGVNYYTGQYFPLKEITEAGHRAGALVGFDLAHAVGNVPLQLHNWNVDFAVWCTYKYLKSSAGGISGIFVHEKHGNNKDIPRFAGWWGHNEEERFLMKEGFIPMHGAEGWQLSNVPVLIMAAHKASLDIFDEAGMHRLIAKSRKLTGYLESLVELLNKEQDKIDISSITPKDIEARGCQLSLVLSIHGKLAFKYLSENGVVADWREPNVIRVAPVPLYNNFTDVFKFYRILKDAIENIS